LDNLPQTNREIRQWYHKQLSQIPKLNEEWIKDGISLRVRAVMAWEFRDVTRFLARTMMEDEAERESLRQRDIAIYGTPDGPTFEFLVKRLKAEGLKGNAVFEAIIKGSYRTNAGTDKMLGF
jgi:hypothetical protein